jgi:hypothetical protein
MRAAMIKAFGEPAEVMTQCPVARSQFVGRQYRKARIGPFGVEWLWPSNAEM